MVSISLTVEIPDFDRVPIELPCPVCGLHTWVRLGEIRRRDLAVCRGCHANVVLYDHLGSVHRFVRGVEKTLRDFGG